MITNNLPLKVLSVPPQGKDNHSMFAMRSQHVHRYIGNFIANIFSKALLSLFADFNSPLKHSTVR